MRNSISHEASVKGLFILLFRVFLWILLLTFLSLVTFLTIGYLNSSKNISYLPDIQTNDLINHSKGSQKFELKSPWYILSAGENGGVTVKSINGELIMSSLTYYTSYDKSKEKWGLDKTSVKLTSDSTISIDGEGQPGAEIRILLTVPKAKPVLEVKVNTTL